jgi:hypothetical protein
MHSRLSTRNAKRFRRARRRGRMIPAEAQKISTRTRFTDYPVTKNIMRFHRYDRNWFFKQDWFED